MELLKKHRAMLSHRGLWPDGLVHAARNCRPGDQLGALFGPTKPSREAFEAASDGQEPAPALNALQKGLDGLELR